MAGSEGDNLSDNLGVTSCVMPLGGSVSFSPSFDSGV